MINESLARRAKEMRSFNDYKEGSATAEYNAVVADFKAKVDKAKAQVSEEGKQRLDKLLDTFTVKYANWINAYNANSAKVPSIMISGAGNYPVRRHEKMMAREGKLWQEYEQIKEMEHQISAIVRGDKIIKSNDADAIEKLKDKLEKALKEHEGYKEYNKKARKEGKTPLAPYVLQNSNGRIRNIRKRIEKLEKIAELEITEEVINGIRIVDNTEAHRIQVFFEGKPDADTRNELKSNGFRWAPSRGAWQSYRNSFNLKKAVEIASKDIEYV